MERRDFLKSGGLVAAACVSGIAAANIAVREERRTGEIYVNSYVELGRDLQDSAVIGFYESNDSEVPEDFG